jgi:hypothetical protein
MKQTAQSDESQDEYLKVLKIKSVYERRLMAMANVVGVGVGKAGENFILVVLVKQQGRKTIHPKEDIPNEIEGVKIEIRQIGQPGAQQN